MSLGAEHPAGATGWPLWPVLLLIVGVEAAAIGVAMNESGLALGRVLILLGLPMAATGGLLAVVRRERREGAAAPTTAAPQASQATTTIANAATKLGFKLEGGCATGVINKRTIELRPESGDVAICVHAAVTRELDMGLSVTRGREPGDARKEVHSGDNSFDSLYCVRADDHDRGKQILSERLREQLVHAHAQLDDKGAQLLISPGEEEELGLAIRLAARVASELDRASAHVPCAEPLREVREAWLAFAQEKSLATADTPLSMWGEVEGMQVSAIAVRDAFQHFHFELEASFPAPLGRGLAMRPASSATQFDRSGEPVGHPAFDRIFVVKSTDPTDSARLVGPETRQAILQLRDTGLQLRAKDSGLWAWVGLNRSDVDLVPRGLNRMVQIASRIASNAERFPQSGR
jgi:hypothetical protein